MFFEVHNFRPTDDIKKLSKLIGSQHYFKVYYKTQVILTLDFCFFSVERFILDTFFLLEGVSLQLITQINFNREKLEYKSNWEV